MVYSKLKSQKVWTSCIYNDLITNWIVWRMSYMNCLKDVLREFSEGCLTSTKIESSQWEIIIFKIWFFNWSSLDSQLEKHSTEKKLAFWLSREMKKKPSIFVYPAKKFAKNLQKNFEKILLRCIWSSWVEAIPTKFCNRPSLTLFYLNSLFSLTTVNWVRRLGLRFSCITVSSSPRPAC